ncbi:MAG: hypothetical protein K0B00_06975 [Rhodobacteraceae bacterium]|nr:hypothetical protein [Paracoccaceae bacterium]
MSKAVENVVVALALVVAGAAPAAAQTFTPPKGCTLSLTVQMRQCQVANVYSCASDEPGNRWISYADGVGVYFSSRIDHETRWMESIDHDTGEIDRLLPKANDHASFSTLIATGSDDYDFLTENTGGVVERYVGLDRLTGDSVMIDGIALERSTFDLSSYDASGAFLTRRMGTQFISRELRLFFGDTEVFENAAGDRVESFQPPVTFALPGEDGFGSLVPLFDCNAVLTQAPDLTDHLRSFRHDQI